MARARWSHTSLRTLLSELILDLGAVGVDIPDGKVAIITSGAGIAMATMMPWLPTVGRHGPLLTWGGAVIRDFDTKLLPSSRHSRTKSAQMSLFNFFFQLAYTWWLRPSRVAFASRPSRVVARFKGKMMCKPVRPWLA